MADTETEETIVKSLLLPLANRTVLIANANVAEIISGFILEKEVEQTGVLGLGMWRAREIPFISLELLSGEKISVDINKANYAVFYSISPNKTYDYYAVLMHGIPKFEFAKKDNTQDVEVKTSNDFFVKDVLLDGTPVSIPDLHKLETLKL